jgi:asparagine synthase (glutamine-hydrolysing)
MNHRGWAWQQIINEKKTTLEMVGIKIQQKDSIVLKNEGLARDGIVSGRLAQAQATASGFTLKRDPIGTAPLYYGWTPHCEFCFASEVKALMLT